MNLFSYVKLPDDLRQYTYSDHSKFLMYKFPSETRRCSVAQNDIENYIEKLENIDHPIKREAACFQNVFYYANRLWLHKGLCMRVLNEQDQLNYYHDFQNKVGPSITQFIYQFKGAQYKLTQQQFKNKLRKNKSKYTLYQKQIESLIKFLFGKTNLYDCCKFLKYVIVQREFLKLRFLNNQQCIRRLSDDQIKKVEKYQKIKSNYSQKKDSINSSINSIKNNSKMIKEYKQQQKKQSFSMLTYIKKMKQQSDNITKLKIDQIKNFAKNLFPKNQQNQYLQLSTKLQIKQEISNVNTLQKFITIINQQSAKLQQLRRQEQQKKLDKDLQYRSEQNTLNKGFVLNNNNKNIYINEQDKFKKNVNGKKSQNDFFQQESTKQTNNLSYYKNQPEKINSKLQEAAQQLSLTSSCPQQTIDQMLLLVQKFTLQVQNKMPHRKQDPVKREQKKTKQTSQTVPQRAWTELDRAQHQQQSQSVQDLNYIKQMIKQALNNDQVQNVLKLMSQEKQLKEGSSFLKKYFEKLQSQQKNKNKQISSQNKKCPQKDQTLFNYISTEMSYLLQKNIPITKKQQIISIMKQCLSKSHLPLTVSKILKNQQNIFILKSFEQKLNKKIISSELIYFPQYKASIQNLFKKDQHYLFLIKSEVGKIGIYSHGIGLQNGQTFLLSITNRKIAQAKETPFSCTIKGKYLLLINDLIEIDLKDSQQIQINKQLKNEYNFYVNQQMLLPKIHGIIYSLQIHTLQVK